MDSFFFQDVDSNYDTQLVVVTQFWKLESPVWILDGFERDKNLKFWFVAASVKFYQTALPHLVDIEIFPQSVVNKSTLSESWIRKVRILREFKFQLG